MVWIVQLVQFMGVKAAEIFISATPIRFSVSAERVPRLVVEQQIQLVAYRFMDCIDLLPGVGHL